MELVPTSQTWFLVGTLAHETSVTVPAMAVLLAGENSVIYVETETCALKFAVSRSPMIARSGHRRGLVRR